MLIEETWLQPARKEALSYFVLVFLALFSAFFFWKEVKGREELVFDPPKIKEEKLASFNLKGESSLPPIEIEIPELYDIQIFRISSRPLSNLYEVHIKEKCKKVKMLEKVYLEKDDEGFTFSEEPTCFWMELEEDGGRLKKNLFLEEPFEKKIIKRSFLTYPIERSFGSPPPVFQALIGAKLWAQDLLAKTKAVRLEIAEEQKSYFCFVQEGDYLVLAGRWKKILDPREAEGKPLVQIRTIGQGIEAVGWDAEGRSFCLSFPFSPSMPLLSPIKERITSVSFRTKKQISCKVDDQRLMLRKGEWLINMGKWKVIKAPPSIEDTASCASELFHFEEILEEGGKKILKGVFFNHMRTESSEVKICLSETKMRKRQRIR